MSIVYELRNGNIGIGFDVSGRIVSLLNPRTGTELIQHCGMEENWKFLLWGNKKNAGNKHDIDYIRGKDQSPADISLKTDSFGNQKITIYYKRLIHKGETFDIEVTFAATLPKDAEIVEFTLDIANNVPRRIREAWYPVIGGLGGFEEKGEKGVVHFATPGCLAEDVLRRGMPWSDYIFCIEEETLSWHYPGSAAGFIDLWCEREGLYIAPMDKNTDWTNVRIEKYPPENGGIVRNVQWPDDTPRWMRLNMGKLMIADKGEHYDGPPNAVGFHMGDWHKAADIYRDFADSFMKWPARPKKMKDYVGWQHLLGKTYHNEIYHTFERIEKVAVKVKKRTGLDVVNLYGGDVYGCEADGYYLTPAEELGGPEGFKKMCRTLHENDMKVVMFNHRQHVLNMEDDMYEHYKPWAIKDRLGNPRVEVWYKTTIESMSCYGAGTHYEGNGPMCAIICPYCDEWWDSVLDEFKKLMAMGLDGVQMDMFDDASQICFADNHGHKPGEHPRRKFQERMAWLRKELHAINSEFIICGETILDVDFQYVDLPYSRYREENGLNVFRYTYPELMHNVAIDAYAYDQVNKSLYLGYGMDSEMWVLKRNLLDTPPFMDYIEQIVSTRRRYPDYLINGFFRDHFGAEVDGDVTWSVFYKGESRNRIDDGDGIIIVLWNKSCVEKVCSVSPDNDAFINAVLWLPDQGEKSIECTCGITIPPHRAGILVLKP